MCKCIAFGLKLKVLFSCNLCLVGVKNQIKTAQMAPPAALPVWACKRRGPVFKALMPTLIF